MSKEREPLFIIPADLDSAVRSVRSRGSCVYFIQAKSVRRIKIGFACELMNRICALATASAETLELLAVLQGRRQDEKYLHRHFHTWRVRGEWFEEAPDLLSFIQHLRANGDAGWKPWLREQSRAQKPAEPTNVVRLSERRG